MLPGSIVNHCGYFFANPSSEVTDKTGSDQELFEESQHNQENEPNLTMKPIEESLASIRQQLRHEFDLLNFLPSGDSALDDSRSATPDPDTIKTEAKNHPNAQSESAVPVNDEMDDPADAFLHSYATAYKAAK